MRLTLTISTLLLAACSAAPPAVVAPAPDRAPFCAALSADLPIQYHSKTVDAESAANIKRGNARYSVVCFASAVDHQPI